MVYSISLNSVDPGLTMRGVAADVLTPTGAVIPSTAMLEEAEQRLVTLGASELYVVAPDGQLAGILPDYEVLKLRLAGENRRKRVSDLMSAAEPRVSSTTPIAELALKMRSSCHRRLPVVVNGRLIGEVTRRNVLRHLHAAETDPFVRDENERRRTQPSRPKFLRSDDGSAPSGTSPPNPAPGIAFTS